MFQYFKRNRKRLLVSAVLLVGLLFLDIPQHARAADPTGMNILLITADDLGYEAVDIFGGTVENVTPNMDRFASQSMSFENAHVNVAICAPSRSVIATGRYGHNSGLFGFNKLSRDIPTTFGTFQNAGYLTGILGKISHSTPDLNFTWDFEHDYAELGSGRSPTRYYDYCTEFFARCKAEEKPFYFMVNSHDPHRPFHDPAKPMTNAEEPSRQFTPDEIAVPSYLTDLPGVRGEIAHYYNSVRRFDDTLGRVLQSLDESGMADNTLVVMITDNGSAFPFAKANTYYASTRTPCLMRWPGVTTPDSVDAEHLISEVDFFPTFMEVAGLDPPKGLDGRSVAPLLRGELQEGREYVFSQIDYTIGGPAKPMRSIQDHRFRYIFNAFSDGEFYYRNNNEGLTMAAMVEAAEAGDDDIQDRIDMYRHRVPQEFYDLDADPGCVNNLIDDPAFQAEADRFQSRLREWMIETNDHCLAAFDARNDAESLAAEMERYPKLVKPKKNESTASAETSAPPLTDEERAAQRRERRDAEARKNDGRPNVVLFLVDDLGYHDMSCRGSDIQTPNIDSIMRSGVDCTQAYATAPVCAPSRAALLTGRYQHRFGFEDNTGPFRRSPDIEMGLDVNEQTIADQLKALGYATGMVGKWHDGEGWEFQPPQRGFDEYYGFNNGAQRYIDVDSSETPMMRGNALERHGEGYLTDTFGREAAAFVERHRNEPFFLYVPFNAPHGPLTAPAEYMDKYPDIEDPNRRTYAAMVDAIDCNIGLVLDQLKSNNIEDNTLILFLSDHGGVFGEKHDWSDNGPLRAGKGTLFEGGLRTPLFAQWKAGLPEGTTFEHPIATIDLLPTAVAAAGGEIADEWELDGVDLLPYLRGENQTAPHETLYWRMNEMWAIRKGDWKVHKDRGTRPSQLFNLDEDPGEQVDLAEENSDQLAALTSDFDAWAATVEHPRFGWWQGVGERYEPPQASGPNIVFIFSDDHALRTISAYGGELNETPNIDRLANEGAIFTRSYCTNSICCPSRATILTGKHSHLNGVEINGSEWDGRQFVFTRPMSEGGYQTAVIGKWHLKGWPTDEFDYWKLLSGGGGQGHYYNPEFQNMDGSIDQIEGYSTDVITDESIRWMEEQTAADRPFMLMCNFKAPHIHRIPPPRHMDICDGVTLPEPSTLFDDYAGRTSYAEQCWMRLFGMEEHILNITPLAGQYDMTQREFEFLGRMTPEQRDAFHRSYDPENEAYRTMIAEGRLEGRDMDRYKYQRFVKDYVGCVAAVDDNVGRILDYLESEGLADDTVVVYSSDQGFFTGEHGWNDKRWMYEETLSMPLLMRWPEHIAPGTVVDAMVQNIDYAPTFLDMVGLPIPREVQGRSLVPLFEEDTPDDWRQSIYYHYYQDGAYNLPRFEGVRSDRYKLINYYFPRQEWELFDLEADPQELQSVYDDPRYAEVRAAMEQELTQLREEYDLVPLPEASE